MSDGFFIAPNGETVHFGGMSHFNYVRSNPEVFGLDKNQLKLLRTLSYDDEKSEFVRTLFDRGWIRGWASLDRAYNEFAFESKRLDSTTLGRIQDMLMREYPELVQEGVKGVVTWDDTSGAWIKTDLAELIVANGMGDFSRKHVAKFKGLDTRLNLRAPAGFKSTDDGVFEPNDVVTGDEEVSVKMPKLTEAEYRMTVPNLMTREWSTRPYFVTAYFDDVNKLGSMLGGRTVSASRNRVVMDFDDIHTVRQASRELQKECYIKSDEIEIEMVKTADVPSWSGASEVYSKASKVLDYMAQHGHVTPGGKSWVATGKDVKRRSMMSGQKSVSDDMRNLIEALDEGDEERIKGLLLLYRQYWPEAFKEARSDFPTAMQIEQIIDKYSEPTDIGAEAFIRVNRDKPKNWFQTLIERLTVMGNSELAKDIRRSLEWGSGSIVGEPRFASRKLARFNEVQVTGEIWSDDDSVLIKGRMPQKYARMFKDKYGKYILGELTAPTWLENGRGLEIRFDTSVDAAGALANQIEKAENFMQLPITNDVFITRWSFDYEGETFNDPQSFIDYYQSPREGRKQAMSESIWSPNFDLKLAVEEDLVKKPKGRKPLNLSDDQRKKLQEGGYGKQASSDDHAKAELKLFIENDENLYRQQIVPIIKNIQRRLKNGTYDHNLAPKLWGYLAENGAKRYNQELGGGSLAWNRMFPMDVRRELAQELADEYIDRIESGEFDEVTAMRKNADGSFRQKLLADGYKIDSSGIIRSPGKFEAEPYYVVYFYEGMMDGGAEEEVSYGEGDGGVGIITLMQEDFDVIPELVEEGYSVGERIGIETTNQGFVGIMNEPEQGWDKWIEEVNSELYPDEDEGGYGKMASVKIEFSTDNAAFEGESRNMEIARVLTKAQDLINRGESGSLRDVNGNVVGNVEVDGEDVYGMEDKWREINGGYGKMGIVKQAVDSAYKVQEQALESMGKPSGFLRDVGVISDKPVMPGWGGGQGRGDSAPIMDADEYVDKFSAMVERVTGYPPTFIELQETKGVARMDVPGDEPYELEADLYFNETDGWLCYKYTGYYNTEDDMEEAGELSCAYGDLQDAENTLKDAVNQLGGEVGGQGCSRR